MGRVLVNQDLHLLEGFCRIVMVCFFASSHAPLVLLNYAEFLAIEKALIFTPRNQMFIFQVRYYPRIGLKGCCFLDLIFI